MHGFIGEFMGTFTLIALGVGTGAEVNLKRTEGCHSNWNFITFTWGLAFAFAIYVAGSFGSEAHLNPAVTIAFALYNKLPANDVLPYLAGQFLGAFCGAAAAAIHYWQHFKATKTKEDGNVVGIFATGPAIYSPINNLMNEIFDTFILVFVLLNLGKFTVGLQPLIIGLMVMMIGNSLGGTTGFSMNPARDLMPRLAYTILPIPNKTDANWGYAWIASVGPMIGAIIAVGAHKLIHQFL
ncbi:MAG: MIP/aquaporin family protein [Lactobacillus sp.]|nr:MIP/aquaporin family protein [Lactobacillus sp.]